VLEDPAHQPLRGGSSLEALAGRRVVPGEVPALLHRDAPAQLARDRVRAGARDALVALGRDQLLRRAPRHPQRDEGVRRDRRQRGLEGLLDADAHARAGADLALALEVVAAGSRRWIAREWNSSS
jgi:hypothetical protein